MQTQTESHSLTHAVWVSMWIFCQTAGMALMTQWEENTEQGHWLTKRAADSCPLGLPIPIHAQAVSSHPATGPQPHKAQCAFLSLVQGISSV